MGIERLLSQQPVHGRIIYIDMDSFFASVEQQVNPDLRGKPVAICPFLHNATSVIAASIEAKRLGVRTGTPVRMAKQLCPGLVLLADTPTSYRQFHSAIMAELAETRCQVEVRSIDEAALTVPYDLVPTAPKVAHEVQERIFKVGSQLSCSVGIASNRFLAKMATKLHKPGGIAELRPEDLPVYYELLELTDLYGISWRMERRLNRLGITTPQGFYQASHQLLEQAFGIEGTRWYLRLRGYEVDGRQTKRGMIGHQTTITPEPATEYDQIALVASQLCHRASYRLRLAGLAARCLSVGLRYSDRSKQYRRYYTHYPFWDADSCVRHASKLLKDIPLDQPVRLVDVSLSRLSPQADLTLSLFPEKTPFKQISSVVDQINGRWGRGTIKPALHLGSQQARDRIGFGNAHQMASEKTLQT
ncbi:DNA polymerase IV [Patescibacteria group bacterium]|nr:MAG: DNA polymerase IV [Patescibacteria group bacterium]